MRIDVWSDVVCPWCYIGFTRLDKAIADSGYEVEVFHHAFQLDPTASEIATPAPAHLAEKLGVAVEDALGMMSQVTAIAAEEGLNYKLGDTFHGNTLLAHRLLAMAATQGLQHELLTRLFTAYFENAEKIFSADELRPHAIAVGLAATEVDALFESDEFTDVIEYDLAVAQQIGIRGVPFFVIDQKLAVAGAESVETLVSAMQHAASGE